MAKKKFKRSPLVAPSAPLKPAPSVSKKRSFIEQYASVAVFLICLISFFVHLHGAGFERRKGMTTVDESVYARLAFQLKSGQPYNTIQLYQESLRGGRQLPEYFKDPLFKHPPFFPYLISLAYTVLEKKDGYSFKELYGPASVVANLMGCVLIWLCFLMGRRLYDYRVGLLAALFIALEVNLLNTSMKVWMDSTLAAMFWLSLYFFHKGIEKKWFLVLGGIAGGCALLTKYPAVLLFAVIMTYYALCERRVFRSYPIYLGLAATGVVLLPWVIINLEIYGDQTLTLGQFRGWDMRAFTKFFIVAGVFSAALAAVLLIRWKQPALYQRLKAQAPKARLAAAGLLTLFVIFLLSRGDFRLSLVKSVTWFAFPWSGWEMYRFNAEPRYFYFKQLLEYSPLYLFFLAGLIRAPLGSRSDIFLLCAVFWTMAFTSFYGSFQGRYILYFTPAGMLLAAATIVAVIDALRRQPQAWLRWGATALFCLTIVYFTAKTAQVGLYQAVNNNAAYY